MRDAGCGGLGCVQIRTPSVSHGVSASAGAGGEGGDEGLATRYFRIGNVLQHPEVNPHIGGRGGGGGTPETNGARHARRESASPRLRGIVRMPRVAGGSDRARLRGPRP